MRKNLFLLISLVLVSIEIYCFCSLVVVPSIIHVAIQGAMLTLEILILISIIIGWLKED